MLEIKYIRENRDDVINRMRKRNIDITVQVDELIELDNKRKKIKTKLDKIRHETKIISKNRSVSFGANRSPKPC